MSIILVLTGCNQNKPDVATNQSYALFVYMSGSNLESGAGAGSRVINTMLNTEYGDNVSVYLQTGGSNSWKINSIPSDKVMRYTIENHQLQVVENLGDINMGEQTTFESFVDFSKQVDAQNKVLLMWGHGTPFGICPDERYKDDALTYQEISDALKDNYFNLIVFNACLTANIDLMTMVSEYADFAIASEEVLPSNGLDYSAMLNLLSQNQSKSMSELGKQIIDDTLAKYSNSTIKDTLTLSLIDLNQLKASKNQLSSYFEQISAEWQIVNWYKSASQANSIGMVGKDLYDIEDHYVGTKSTLSNILDKVIVYEIHGVRYDTDGLYVFYKDKMSVFDINSYAENCAYQNYYDLIKHKINFDANNQYIDYINQTIYGDNLCEVWIDNVSYNYLVMQGAFIFTDDLEIWSIDINGVELQQSDNKYIIYPTDTTLKQLQWNGVPVNYAIYTVQEDKQTNSLRIMYVSVVEVNGVKGYLYFSYTFKDGSYAKGEYEILGFIPNNADNKENNSTKGILFDTFDGATIEPLSVGDTIVMNGISFNYNGQTLQIKERTKTYTLSLFTIDIYGNMYLSDGFVIDPINNTIKPASINR